MCDDRVIECVMSDDSVSRYRGVVMGVSDGSE